MPLDNIAYVHGKWGQQHSPVVGHDIQPRLDNEDGWNSQESD
jgi:hypothetical protein